MVEKKPIFTTKAPEVIGPYSQAIKVGNLLYLSGQIPFNPETKQLVTNNIEEEAHQVFNNLQEVLIAANCTFEHVVKLTIFLTDLSSFSLVNNVMAQYFVEPYPARSTIGVAALPKGVNIEVEAIAVLG